MEQYYKCFSTDLNKRELIPYDDKYRQTVEFKISRNPTKEYFESIYLYNQDHYNEFQKTKSLSGISGLKTDKVVFDFDSNDLNQAKQDTVQLISRLIQKYPEKSIGCYFSSNKGFHVELKLNNLINKEQFSLFVDNYASDLKTFDVKIRDEQRIFRYPTTINKKSNLYKIPLKLNEVMSTSIEDIKKQAETVFDHHDELIESWEKVDITKELESLSPPKKEIELNSNIIVSDKPDMSRKPSHLTSAKYVLQEGFFDEGDRNEACMILASTYKYLGYNKETAYNILKATLRLRAKRLNLPKYNKTELWEEIIKIVFSDSWNGGVYSEENSKLIKKTIEKYHLKDEFKEKSIITIKELSSRFLSFAKNININKITTGIEEIDKNVLITSGMMVGLLGAPSSGKTTLSLNFLEHQSKKDVGTFFVSADMPEPLVYARMLQRYCGKSLEDIVNMIETNDYRNWDKELKNAWELVDENFKNVGMSFRSGPTIDDIEKRIDEHEQLTGKKVKLLVVDYLEKIRCNMTDSTASTGYNASRLADLTRDKDLGTILLLQPQKSAGDPSDDLLSMRKIKGASVIEQDCRIIMTAWRPGFNPDYVGNGSNPDDRYMSVAVVKNNMGKTGRMNFTYDGKKGLIESIKDNEIGDFNRVCKENKERKNNTIKETNELF